MSKDAVQQLLQKYTYNVKAGKEVTPTLQVFKAVHQENNTPAQIKIIKAPTDGLLSYLQKLKETKSDYMIKVIDFVGNKERAVLITEDVPYGTLGNAMSRCRRLQDNDALFVAKSVLNGHIDMLRNGGQWSGGLNDIEVTDTGLKLSWNGSVPTQVNPMPGLIQKLTARDPQEEKGLLPFPKNKLLADLVKVAVQNASELSLHPQLKKRDKIFKKKGKGWIALRQNKNKGQYFEETTYLAVSPIHGLVRVKQFEQGRIDKQCLALNKTKNSFVKVIDQYDQGSYSYMVSEYANDGNLQQYVAKLKTANILLKEDQIQFFLYSLLDPIKLVQNSTLKSLNSLHIRNIFIESGIPKIGEPIPMTVKIEETMKDRWDVPDFYHPRFKSDPMTRDPSYDTYSLGILLYRLMYTEYPIFPEGKVHIPTTPSFNQRIKTTLQLLLNEGGKISDIETRIEVSETVKKQIKENKAKLEAQKVKPRNVRVANEYEKKEEEVQQILENDVKANEEDSCWKMLCQASTQDQQGKIQHSYYIECENSPFRRYRICTKILLVALFYILVMYLWFLTNTFDLFVKTLVLQPLNVTINSVNYTVVTPDTYTFYTSFNSTGTKSLNDLSNSLNCAIDGSQGDISTYVKGTSSGWLLYLSMALLACVLIILIKVVQIANFDLIKTMYYYQTRKYNFNISSYVVFNLLFVLALYSHFFIFHYVYQSQTSPCFGGDDSMWYSSTVNLFGNRNYVICEITQLYQYIMPPVLASFLLLIGSFIQIMRHDKNKYSKIVNPIFFFVPGLLALTIMMRIGVYLPFQPSWINSTIWMTQLRKFQYVTAFGIFPEILLIGEHALTALIDWIFWRCLDRRVGTLIHDESMSEDLRDQRV